MNDRIGFAVKVSIFFSKSHNIHIRTLFGFGETPLYARNLCSNRQLYGSFYRGFFFLVLDGIIYFSFLSFGFMMLFHTKNVYCMYRAIG